MRWWHTKGCVSSMITGAPLTNPRGMVTIESAVAKKNQSFFFHTFSHILWFAKSVQRNAYGRTVGYMPHKEKRPNTQLQQAKVGTLTRQYKQIGWATEKKHVVKKAKAIVRLKRHSYDLSPLLWSSTQTSARPTVATVARGAKRKALTHEKRSTRTKQRVAMH